MCLGESCSGIKKAKFSKHLPEVEKAFGDTAAKLNMGEKDELTLENVLSGTNMNPFQSLFELFICRGGKTSPGRRRPWGLLSC